MDAETNKRIAALEARIAALEAKDKKNDADFIYYINQHGELHRDTDRMVFASYFKTHQQFWSAMDRFG